MHLEFLGNEILKTLALKTDFADGYLWKISYIPMKKELNKWKARKYLEIEKAQNGI